MIVDGPPATGRHKPSAHLPELSTDRLSDCLLLYLVLLLLFINTLLSPFRQNKPVVIEPAIRSHLLFSFEVCVESSCEARYAPFSPARSPRTWDGLSPVNVQNVDHELLHIHGVLTYLVVVF